MAGLDAAAFAAWSVAAAALMGATALSYRAYCRAGRRGRGGSSPIPRRDAPAASGPPPPPGDAAAGGGRRTPPAV